LINVKFKADGLGHGDIGSLAAKGGSGALGRLMGETSGIELLARVRAVLGTVDLDCACREKLDDALRRFAALEQRRGMRDLIADARAQCERVAALLDLLKELDEIEAEDADLGVFDELALLFETIAAAGMRGAEDMRRFRELMSAGSGTRATVVARPLAQVTPLRPSKA